MISAEEKALVKQTWTAVVPIADKAAELFYGRLFELDPEVKPLFKGDMKEQGAKLMKTIGIAVNALDNLEPLVPTLKQLGAAHAGYGVKDAHYDTVAAALLWTLEQGLGDSYNTEVEQAWVAVYGIVADTMRAGAAEAAA